MQQMEMVHHTTAWRVLTTPFRTEEDKTQKILNINGEAAGVCQMVGGVGSFWPLIHKTQFGMGPGAVPQPPHRRIMSHIYTSGYKPFNIQGIWEAYVRITPSPTEVAAFWEDGVATA